jgi:hypothetical protein
MFGRPIVVCDLNIEVTAGQSAGYIAENNGQPEELAAAEPCPELCFVGSFGLIRFPF